MRHMNPLLVVALFVGSLVFTACRQHPDTPSRMAPSVVESDPDSTIYRVRLTSRVAERLDIKTALVREERVSSSETLRKVISKSAVFTDPQGNSWTFTNPEPLAYVRRRIHVDRTYGDLAVLLDGPPVGTPVVTVGAEQLLLREIGVVQ